MDNTGRNMVKYVYSVKDYGDTVFRVNSVQMHESFSKLAGIPGVQCATAPLGRQLKMWPLKQRGSHICMAPPS